MNEFVDLETTDPASVDPVDLVFDVIGGDLGERSVRLVRAGGTLIKTPGPPTLQPGHGRAVFFVVEADLQQLTQITNRVRDGPLRTRVGAVHPLEGAVQAFNPAKRPAGKIIITVG